jgi:hypothetical protein
MPKRKSVRNATVKAVVNMTQGRTPYEMNEIHVDGMGRGTTFYEVCGPGICRRMSGYWEMNELQTLLNIAYQEGQVSTEREKAKRKGRK